MDKGVYLLSDPKYDIKLMISTIENSPQISYFQYRNKNANNRLIYNQALLFKQACAKHNIAFIVNDRVDIALAVEADGVHLGQSDVSIEVARSMIGDKIIGISVTNVEEALKAQAQGADYIGVGAMYYTKTKSDATYVSLESLIEIAKNVSIPIVCIGGINLQNAPQLVANGASMLAVISDIWESEDACRQILKYQQLF